jgi:long-chain fatty acid transport protein
VAYRVNDRFSVGFGINYAKVDIKFQQATPYVGSPVATLKGDDNAWGYNFGLMYQLSDATRLGFSYRSRIKFDLTGNQTVPGLIQRDIKAELETPDTTSLALHHRVNDRWSLLGDVTWTNWSSLQALSPLTADTGARATAPLRYNFRNTYRVGIGANYELNNQWKLRFGTAYDKNPVPNEASRTMTVPDADRIWLAFGARWTLTPKTSFDFGYAHLFVRDSNTAREVKNTAETTTLQTVRGKFENRADMLSVQMNYNF